MATVTNSSQGSAPPGACGLSHGGDATSRLCVANHAIRTQRAMDLIEDLVAPCKNQSSLASQAIDWLASAPEGVRKEFERDGLFSTAVHQTPPTLANWIRAYGNSRSDVQPGTLANYRKTERDLVSFFGGETPLDRITEGKAKDFHAWMKSVRSLADTTIRRRCKQAKQFFRAAVKVKVLKNNPFEYVPAREVHDRKRVYLVSREETEAVLMACPTAEWRLVFALSRYGGLRCPSEVTRLRWEDVDWARKRFTVYEPKTKCRYGDVRQVPIFPELLPYLQVVFKQAKKDAEYVITGSRRSNPNLAGYLRYHMIKAGLKPWPRITQNLRSTRETELAEDYPLHVVAAWMGHTRRIATRHYLQVTESHYEKAAADTRPSPSEPKAPPTLPEDLADAWADLPEHVETAILTLASTASHPGC